MSSKVSSHAIAGYDEYRDARLTDVDCLVSLLNTGVKGDG